MTMMSLGFKIRIATGEDRRRGAGHEDAAKLYTPLPVNNSAGNSLMSLTCSGGTATFNSLNVSKLNSVWPQP